MLIVLLLLPLPIAIACGGYVNSAIVIAYGIAIVCCSGSWFMLTFF